MRKGDVVIVKAIVETFYERTMLFFERERWKRIYAPGTPSNRKSLYRQEVKPWRGLIIGRSYKATGHRRSGTSGFFPDDYPPYLAEAMRHRILLVEPLEPQQWRKPLACLEEDLELVFALRLPIEKGMT